MGHIHTGAGQHDLVVSAYIFRLGNNGWELLLHKHKKYGRYMQFGGHVELAETPWEAIEHEVLEESGYELGQLQLLQPPFKRLAKLSKVDLHPYPVCVLTYPADKEHHHTDIAYAFVTDEDPKHVIAEGESAEFYALNHTAFMALSDDALFANVREIGDYIFTSVLQEWERQKVAKGTT